MRVLVVGNGPVGLLTALNLQAEGHHVICVGDEEPGRGVTARGAGVLARHAHLPLSLPGLWRSPARLLGSTGQFRLQPLYTPRALPWLLRFLWQSRRRPVHANTAALTRLLASGAGELEGWLAAAGAPALVREQGALRLYPTAAARAHDGLRRSFHSAHGIPHQLLDRDAVAAQEPRLTAQQAGGVVYPASAHLSDPAAALAGLATLFRARGGRHERDTVRDVRPSSYGGVVARGTHLGRLRADRAVVTCGARARRIASRLGDRLPLAAQRSYMLRFPGAGDLLSQPVLVAEQPLWLAPTGAGLAASGLSLLGGLNFPPQSRHLADLSAMARRILPELGDPEVGWSAHTGLTPDSRPVIGRSAAGGDIVYAFGLGEFGLAYAGASARLAADLVAHRSPGVPADAYRPGRFYAMPG